MFNVEELRDLNYRRLLIFFILVIVLGLLQLWVLLVVLKALDQPVELKRLIGDGGLFFFSTSLAIGSAITLWDQKSTNKHDDELILLTIILPGGIFFLTIAWTVAIMTKDGLSVQYPFQRTDSIFLQLACTLAAITYWFVTGLATDMFKRKRLNNGFSYRR
jgi:hypothetical protein